MRAQSIEPHPDSPTDFPNINVTFSLLADQNEPSLAINPTDPRNIVLSCNDYRSDTSLWYFVSNDGGVHWDGAPFSSKWPASASATDPGIAFDYSGRAFASYGRASAGFVPAPAYQMNDVVTFASTDKGANWNGPVRVVFDSDAIGTANQYADKYYIAADLDSLSPYAGAIYVTWANYINGKSAIAVSHSTDHGATWSAPSFVTPYGQFQSPIPVVRQQGTLMVAYEDIDPSHRSIYVARSVDGGISFSPRLVTQYTDLGRLYPSSGDQHPVIKGHVRVNSFPSIAAGSGQRLYVTYAGRGADLRPHIYFSRSDNGGFSWYEPVAIDGDSSTRATDKFFPWIAVDQATGDIGIVYYDSRNDSLHNELIDAYLLFSHDFGATFTPLRLSGSSFDPKASSSRDSVGSSADDSLEFIGDYLSIDGRNKRWVAAWSDSRVGYDQDIYVAIVRPYAPAAVQNFQAVENTASHQPDLSWQYTARTTAGMPLATYNFHLRRDDGGLDTMLDASILTFHDEHAALNKNYRYSIQVVAAADTSSTAYTNYYPRTVWEPLPPTIISATAQPGGFQTNITIPSRSVSGDTVHGLYKLYYILDDVTTDSAIVRDAQRGATLAPFTSTTDGFHKFQIVIAVQLPSGDTVLSVRTAPHWLYAGTPYTDYSEDFTTGSNVFSIFGWSTTTAAGAFTTPYINDSLPFVNYAANEDTWFCLPPVVISAQTKTLEFDHIAAVATEDSAWLEYSLDDGLSFVPLAEFDTARYPNDWKHTLAGSSIRHEAISVTNVIGHNLIARYRLRTNSSSADGWFIGNIKYSDALGVAPTVPSVLEMSLRVVTNPVTSDLPASVLLRLFEGGRVTLSAYDMLGREVVSVLGGDKLDAGAYEINIPGLLPGTYTIVCRLASGAVATTRVAVLR
ncbi:MAG: exo-alpha-sialidase [Bacteroidetes bacterium]|nr:exo-alpha-sialidase [Bacteroidota bacterium]